MEDFTSLHSKIFDEIKENNVIIYTPHCAFKYNKLIFNCKNFQFTILFYYIYLNRSFY